MPRSILILLSALFVFVSALPAQDEPELPAGLGGEDEPELPAGLSGEDEQKPKPPPETRQDTILDHLPFDLSGFMEARAGYRTQHDKYEKDMTIGETRLQLEAEKQWTQAMARVTADFLYDHVADHHGNRLEKGEGWIDLREAFFSFTPADSFDVKAGRQILTWGTGDLLFINDLFPKDWNSFFIGRDEAYLKAPSDAVKGSFFSDYGNADLVFTPRFDPDRYIDGRRISFWNASLGRRSGRDAPVRVDLPDDWIEDSETALRLFKNFKGYETALYGYNGYWKSPAGMDPATGRATFPDLQVYGASLRGPLFSGIANMEAGYYHSSDDQSGHDPFTRNSEVRFLAGYEQEAAKNFTAGAQFYMERMLRYSDYERNLPAGSKKADEIRYVLTLRLTRLLMNQNMTLSLFNFYSPTDGDAYFRPSAAYKVDDHLSVELGGNIFVGKDNYTFFGQFEKNNNLYLGVRYSF